MAGSLNRVMLIGRLTRDPELRYTPSGTAVCNLAIATNRYGSDPATGERKEFADYHDVVVWNSAQPQARRDDGAIPAEGSPGLRRGAPADTLLGRRNRAVRSATRPRSTPMTCSSSTAPAAVRRAGRRATPAAQPRRPSRSAVAVTSTPMTFPSRLGEPCLISTAAAARCAASAWSTSTSSTTRRSPGCAGTSRSAARSCRAA